MLGSLSGVLAGVSSWVSRGIYATPRIDVADGPDEIGGLPTITEWRKQNRHRHQLRT